MAAPQLAPVASAIGIFPELIARQPETLVLRGRMIAFSGAEFDIKLADGTPILRVKIKFLTISGRKSVHDVSGNHLFDIVKEPIHLRRTFAAVDSQDRKIMQIKRNIAVAGFNTIATFISPSTGKSESLEMKTKWHLTQADIADSSSGQSVARIDRTVNWRDWFARKHAYTLTVAPGVDMALMAAMCICLDQQYDDHYGWRHRGYYGC